MADVSLTDLYTVPDDSRDEGPWELRETVDEVGDRIKDSCGERAFLGFTLFDGRVCYIRVRDIVAWCEHEDSDEDDEEVT